MRQIISFNNKNWQLPTPFIQPIPNDEIWYTSLDGNIVIPYRESSLPPIVSNTYENGKGIIKCDSDITYIRDYAFGDCTGLTSVFINNSVTNLGEGAFTGCTGLKNILIGNSVTSILEAAFRDCSSLTSVTIPNSVSSINEKSFLGCSGLTSLSVEAENTVYDSRNNCNAIIQTMFNMLIRGCQNTIIPNDIEKIENYAFDYCTGLTSIDIPNSVTSIGLYAFNYCTGLTNLLIGNSVTYIGNYAFHNCTGLTSVIIPVSVTSIIDMAFANCTSLSSISYTGTIAQWNDISKGTNWNFAVPATVVHCTDGDAPI